MELRSTVQLQSAMTVVVSQVLDEVTYDVLIKLQDIIHKVVYNPYDPAEYDRQYFEGGFVGSFKQENAKVDGNRVVSEVNHDPMLMILNREANIHGSDYKSVQWDIRESLAEMIINGGETTKSPHVGSRFGKNGWWMEQRDFWTPFEEWFNANVRNMLIKAFLAKGIKII